LQVFGLFYGRDHRESRPHLGLALCGLRQAKLSGWIQVFGGEAVSNCSLVSIQLALIYMPGGSIGLTLVFRFLMKSDRTPVGPASSQSCSHPIRSFNLPSTGNRPGRGGEILAGGSDDGLNVGLEGPAAGAISISSQIPTESRRAAS